MTRHGDMEAHDSERDRPSGTLSASFSSFLIITDLQGRIVQFTPTTLTGRTPAGYVPSAGDYFVNAFPSDFRSELERAFQRLTEHSQEYRTELRSSSFGPARWLLTLKPLTAGQGNSGVCLFSEIVAPDAPACASENCVSDKQSTRGTEVSQLHFRAFFESAPGRYLVLNPAGFRIVAASEAYLRSTMRTREDIVGRPLFDVFPDNPADPLADGVRNLRESLERVKTYRQPDIMPIQRYPIASSPHPNGAWEERFWSPINSPVFGSDGSVEFIIHRVEDVTSYVYAQQRPSARDHRLNGPADGSIEAEVFIRAHDLQRLNNELRESEQRFRLIVENVKDFAIFTFDEEGKINSWNPGAASVFGFSSAEALGRNVEVIYTPEDRTIGIPQKERHQAHTQGCALNDRWHVRKDGSPIFVSGAVRPLLDRHGKIYGFAKVARDITRLKQTEEALHELTGFVLRLQDHERRRIGRELHDSTAQALAALEMTLSLIEKRAHNLDQRGAALLHECVQLASQCSTEIRTISYLLHPPLLDELGLVSALDWYVKGFSQRSGISVQLAVSKNIGRLSDDSELALFRIVQECLTNIHRHSASPTAAICLQRVTDEIILEIADHGNGMPHPNLQNLRDSPVIGVGLAGMRERVRQLQGRLEVNSNSRGTIVRVVLPARKEEVNVIANHHRG